VVNTQELVSPENRMKTEMARVVVIGTSCVGKTTFAQVLAQIMNFPHVELDALHWQPNWTPRPPEEFRALTADALAQGCWITDGNYGSVRDLVWSQATRMVFLSRESILWWVITTFHRRRRHYRQLFDEATISQLAYVEFRSPFEARNFLSGIGTTL
jgi:adenylate kinase family enzyme